MEWPQGSAAVGSPYRRGAGSGGEVPGSPAQAATINPIAMLARNAKRAAGRGVISGNSVGSTSPGHPETTPSIRALLNPKTGLGLSSTLIGSACDTRSRRPAVAL